ncbi:hypothetical protein LL037_23380 [Clostridium estertheticum]|uniref:Uncharacterized protein n=1 Tax=Clostridium estertheticum TaxID=238834 RepID=A0AA47EHZ3_9CLOT|nr:hypothetical protein [Clostridium estertheticum]MBU3155502.1 hypothetical protein [Clostridium estertheticum]MBU3175465.1 hypothetical protein [Clostridium estertheticum]MBU3199586.1 hypothetical protein [Clostridium estertheticum]MBU3215979.1 hypothetical protein [Clostridium estertheticum]MBW9151191.1 hypothetical protein [Clostridium estertheticum]
MKSREQASKDNSRNYINKDTKSKNPHSKNQIIQSIEESAYNDSVFTTNKSEYGGNKSE